MKEINWIAILSFYLLCPMTLLEQQNMALEPQKVIESTSKPYYLEKSSVCYSLIEAVRIKTPSVNSIVCFVNRTESEWYESKPLVIKGKRFIRPKIIDFPA
jgi:hypothetical protein